MSQGGGFQLPTLDPCAGTPMTGDACTASTGTGGGFGGINACQSGTLYCICRNSQYTCFDPANFGMGGGSNGQGGRNFGQGGRNFGQGGASDGGGAGMNGGKAGGGGKAGASSGGASSGGASSAGTGGSGGSSGGTP